MRTSKWTADAIDTINSAGSIPTRKSTVLSQDFLLATCHPEPPFDAAEVTQLPCDGTPVPLVGNGMQIVLPVRRACFPPYGGAGASIGATDSCGRVVAFGSRRDGVDMAVLSSRLAASVRLVVIRGTLARWRPSMTRTGQGGSARFTPLLSRRQPTSRRESGWQGLRHIGERHSWYGVTEVCGGEVIHASMAHA